MFPILALSESIVVMRHGEAEQNIAKILNSDVKISEKFPLTEIGKKQARDAAKTLKKNFGMNGDNVSFIFTSPLLRARQTAELLARELGVKESKIIVEERIRENGMGRLEGHQEKELDELDHRPKGYLLRAKELFGGENKEELDKRLKDFLKRIKSSESGNVIIITHGTPSFLLLPMLDPSLEGKPQLNRGEFQVFPAQVLAKEKIQRPEK